MLICQTLFAGQLQCAAYIGHVLARGYSQAAVVETRSRPVRYWRGEYRVEFKAQNMTRRYLARSLQHF